jgi:hypothetical protein
MDILPKAHKKDISSGNDGKHNYRTNLPSHVICRIKAYASSYFIARLKEAFCKAKNRW